MNKIDARNYTLNELLEKQKYYINDYQREYRWEKRQIEELLSDLWLKFSVYLVKITTSSEAAGYTIFETMNDRSFNLDSTKMLKGYLIANFLVDKRTYLYYEIAKKYGIPNKSNKYL
ncbi:DUF262 domain-containing protein [Cetobacterium sp.]|uniref:DUF262 domain-containing protein n=1 Tax=Cetobacterium sp. TaxID=2071632 RepID=UPI003EE62BE8